MSRSDDLHPRDVLLEPGDDKMERGAVVDRAALTEIVRLQRFTGRVLRNELWVGLHVADLALTDRDQGSLSRHLIGAELHAGGARVEDNDGLAHGRLLRGFGQ